MSPIELSSDEEQGFEYDFAQVQSQLIVRAATEPQALPWLVQSKENPEEFYKALFRYFDGRAQVAAKSEYNGHVDFYHDLVVRNLGEDLIAYTEYSTATGAWVSMSFDELHARSSALAGEWARLGVEPEQVVALALPVNSSFFLTLVTALRLGLTISFLAPVGKDFVRERLQVIEPDYCICDSRVQRDIHDLEIQALPATAEPGRAADRLLRSFSYEWDGLCAKIFSHWGPERLEPVDVPAGSFFCSLLADVLVALNLKAKDRMMAPGFDLQQHTPAFQLQTLMAGATWAEIPYGQLLARLDLLKEISPTVLGVGPQLRDRLAQIPKSFLPEPRVLFKDPLLPFDWNAWEEFSKHISTPVTTNMNLVVNAAAGGSVLFSRRYEGNCGLEALPKPGVAWALLDVNNSGQPAQGNTGIYSVEGAPDAAKMYGTCVVSGVEHGFMLTGTAVPTRNGQTYPKQEVCELISTHPLVKHASILIQGQAEQLNASRCVLLIFIEPRMIEELPQFEAKLRGEISGMISLGYGEHFLPERVEIFALSPRRTEEGDIDDTWISDQYLSGFLEQKRKIPIFNLIGQLHSIALNPK